jgi:hypothetical protein
MKAKKLIAIALIFGIASLGMAQTETPAEGTPGDVPVQTIIIHLTKAAHSMNMVKAIRAQVSPEILIIEKTVYTEPVRYNHRVYYVTGTYNEWFAFFGHNADSQLFGLTSNLIPIQKAIKTKGLLDAMKAQLKPEMLYVDKPIYIAAVRYKHSISYVYGTLEQWKQFFHIY